MPKVSKRKKAIREIVKPGKLYSLQEAIDTLKKVPPAKFAESVDIAL